MTPLDIYVRKDGLMTDASEAVGSESAQHPLRQPKTHEDSKRLAVAAGIGGVLLGGLFSLVIALVNSRSQEQSATNQYLREQRQIAYAQYYADVESALDAARGWQGAVQTSGLTYEERRALINERIGTFQAKYKEVEQSSATVTIVGSEDVLEDLEAVHLAGKRIIDAAMIRVVLSAPSVSIVADGTAVTLPPELPEGDPDQAAASLDPYINAFAEAADEFLVQAREDVAED
jgi:hypothetical protein